MKFLLLSIVFSFVLCHVGAGIVPCTCTWMRGTWTGWYDRDNPSGVGDWEHLSAYNALPVAQRPCGGRRILCIEYRIKSTNTCWFVGRPEVKCASETASVFYKQSPTEGFVCRNQDQHYVPVGNTFKQRCCCDYQVRYKCSAYSG